MVSMHGAHANPEQIRRLLERVREGELDVETALAALGPDRELDLGAVRLDLTRAQRTGTAEVIWGEGKTLAELEAILDALEKRALPILATRIDADKGAALTANRPELVYEADCRIVRSRNLPEARTLGAPILVTAGTSDGPVAREAYWTLRTYGWEAELVSDVGVAGIHRLFRRLERLQQAPVLIVCAGMEGALASVIAGLVSRPVIAVPTSVGYGAAFSGIAALLGMLTACASGITVCNIDNGFGAAMAALRILGLADPPRTTASAAEDTRDEA